MKILIIDDQRNVLSLLSALLSRRLEGARLLTARTGQRGMELARIERPDVILLDIVMPDMNGFEVCRKLKQVETLRDIPVLFLTGVQTDRDSRIEAVKVGAEGFLTKPIDEVELLARVRALGRVKEAHERLQADKERLAALAADRMRAMGEERADRESAEQALREKDKELERWRATALEREEQLNALKKQVVDLHARLAVGSEDPS